MAVVALAGALLHDGALTVLSLVIRLNALALEPPAPYTRLTIVYSNTRYLPAE